MATFEINKNKIAKNTITLYFRMAFTMLVSFFTTRVTLEILGSEDYGLNNLVGGVVAMFSFINGSMGTAVQRFYSISIGKGDVSKLKKVFGCGLFLHIVVAVITIIIAEVFAIFFIDKLNIPQGRLNAAHVVFQLSMFSMALNILNVPYAALLRAREDFTSIALADIITAVLRLAILYFLHIIPFDKLIIFATLNFIISLWYAAYLTYKARKYPETHSGICRDKDLIKEMLGFVSLLLFTVFAQVIRDNGLTILVNMFFGLALNAAFAIAAQVTNMVNTFVMNFKQAIVPQLMTAWGAGDKEAMHKLISIGTKITFLLMLMISLPVVLESEFLLKVWLKNPPTHASTLVSLAIISINISSFTYYLYQAVHATGRIKRQQVLMSMLYILNIVLVFVAFKFGANFKVAYYISIIISLFQCMVNIYCAKKYIGLSIYVFIRDILIPVILTTVILFACCLLVFFNFEYGWLRFLILVFTEVIVATFAGFLVLLNKKERFQLLSIINLQK